MKKVLYIIIVSFLLISGVMAGDYSDIDYRQKEEEPITLATAVMGVYYAASCTYLLQDDFDSGSDGDNLAAYGSWSGDDNDVIEIDNAYSVSGSYSVKTDTTNTTATYSVKHTYTEQTSGTFTVHVEFAVSNLTESGSSFYPIFLVEDSSGNNMIEIGYYQDDLVYYDSGRQTILLAAIAASNTFYEVEVVFNVTAETMDIYWEGSLEEDDLAFSVSGDPISVSFREWAGSGTGSNWKDNLYIYTGDRNVACH